MFCFVNQTDTECQKVEAEVSLWLEQLELPYLLLVIPNNKTYFLYPISVHRT